MQSHNFVHYKRLLYLLINQFAHPGFLNFQPTISQSKLFDQYYKDYHLNLKMASAQVVKASVMNNPCQDPNHPGDLFQASFLNNVVSHAILNITTFEHKMQKKKQKQPKCQGGHFCPEPFN